MSLRRLIAWDTSTASAVIGAIEWEDADPSQARVLSERALSANSRQSERLLWGVDQICRELGWKIGEIDGYGVGVGPGSFTGLRISLTTARTLGHALQRPVVPFSSLALCARQVLKRGLGTETWVIATAPASQGEIFALWGKSSRIGACLSFPHAWDPEVQEELADARDLASRISSRLNQENLSWVRATLAETQQEKDFFAALPPKRETPLGSAESTLGAVSGADVARMAQEAWIRGLGVQALEVFPRYLRDSEAEKKLKMGLLKPAP